MPVVEISANALGPAVTTHAGEGARLLDLCDATHAPVAFSCRSASCATCRVEVRSGAELLLPARDDEREVLAIFDSSPTQRLACQVVIGGGDGKIHLEWVDE